MSKLAGRKAPGPEISNEMIVHLSDEGREKLLDLTNLSWLRGELPSLWRIAIIIPIHKKRQARDKPSSYRPISLLSCLSKVTERLVQARLYWILEHREGKNGDPSLLPITFLLSSS